MSGFVTCCAAAAENSGFLCWSDGSCQILGQPCRCQYAAFSLQQDPCALQAAAKTNDTAGDGTTTATILSAAIIAEGMKIVAAGANPVQLTRGIERTVAELVKQLAATSTEVTDEGLADVATVSAGNNRVVRCSCPQSRLAQTA